MEGTNIDAMRQISLADFLARLGHEPVRRSGNELWYRAPYRSERTPSFRVNVAKQLWYDFGLGKGGDIFTLAGEFARSGDFMAQARFIAETARMPFVASEKPLYLPEPSEPAFEGVEALKGHYGGRVCDRSALYDGCKDLNEYLQLTAKKEMNNNLKIKGQ